MFVQSTGGPQKQQPSFGQAGFGVRTAPNAGGFGSRGNSARRAFSGNTNMNNTGAVRRPSPASSMSSVAAAAPAPPVSRLRPHPHQPLPDAASRTQVPTFIPHSRPPKSYQSVLTGASDNAAEGPAISSEEDANRALNDAFDQRDAAVKVSDHLRNQNAELQREKMSLLGQLGDGKTREERLRAEVDRLLAGSGPTSDDSSLRCELEEANGKIAELNRRAEELGAPAAFYEGKLAAEQAKLQTAASENAGLIAEVDRLTVLADQTTTMQQQLGKTTAELVVANEKYRMKEEEFEKLSGTHAEHLRRFNKTTEEKKALQEDLENAMGRADRAESEVTRLTAKAELQESMLSGSNALLDEQQTKAAAVLKKTSAALEAEKATVAEMKVKLEEFDTQANELAAMSLQVHSLQAQLMAQRMHARSAATSNANEQWVQAQEMVQASTRPLEVALEEERARIAELEGELSSAAAREQQSQVELSALKSELSALEAATEKAKLGTKANKQMVDAIDAAREEETKSLVQAALLHQSNFSDSRASLQSALAEKSALQRRVESLEAEIATQKAAQREQSPPKPVFDVADAAGSSVPETTSSPEKVIVTETVVDEAAVDAARREGYEEATAAAEEALSGAEGEISRLRELAEGLQADLDAARQLLEETTANAATTAESEATVSSEELGAERQKRVEVEKLLERQRQAFEATMTAKDDELTANQQLLTDTIAEGDAAVKELRLQLDDLQRRLEEARAAPIETDLSLLSGDDINDSFGADIVHNADEETADADLGTQPAAAADGDEHTEAGLRKRLARRDATVHTLRHELRRLNTKMRTLENAHQMQLGAIHRSAFGRVDQYAKEAHSVRRMMESIENLPTKRTRREGSQARPSQARASVALADDAVEATPRPSGRITSRASTKLPPASPRRTGRVSELPPRPSAKKASRRDEEEEADVSLTAPAAATPAPKAPRESTAVADASPEVVQPPAPEQEVLSPPPAAPTATPKKTPAKKAASARKAAASVPKKVATKKVTEKKARAASAPAPKKAKPAPKKAAPKKAAPKKAAAKKPAAKKSTSKPKSQSKK